MTTQDHRQDPRQDPTPTELAETYFEAWQARDFDRLAGVLAEDVTFDGALGSARGREECLAGLRGMSRVLDHLDVQVRVAQGDDVVTWFDLHTTVAPPAPTANWSHVVDGRIAAIRVTFDPRGILAAG